eukprot:SRR837773.5939.p1 GENE.SRR837773.5939~~SRR837773.5939.p1  ORF type:complete len:439 (+),score=171.28 SRR837773.5939:105-1319(+)
MVCVYALGKISGANFNPAVTFALAVTKSMEWPKAGAYMATQLAASAAAGFSYKLLFGKSFNLTPSPGFGWGSVALAEIIYTAMLVYVVLNTAVANKVSGNQYFGLAIGFVIVAGAYGAGAISGGCFNPPVAFGIDISSLGLGFGWCIFYALCEILGAYVAVVLYKIVRQEEFGYEESTGNNALCSEMVGTFMLVLTVGLNVLAGSKAAAFSIAASLMCMIYATGDVSGAHYNPAVTLAIFASGRCPEITTQRMASYMAAQIGAGVVASMTYMVMMKGEVFSLGPGVGYDLKQALVAEVIFTFVLCYVVLTVAVAKITNNPVFFGLAIGACVTVGGNAIGAVSGGSLNPAVSVGIAFSNWVQGGRFAEAVFYTAAELLGATAAAVVFEVTHAVDKTKGELEPLTA